MKEHVVVAMVGANPAKVECTSCHKQHLYRSGPPGEKKEAKAARAAGGTTRSRRAAPAPTPQETVDVAARVANRTPQKYDPQHKYALDDVVAHPSFGTGIVIALPGAQKIEVVFDSGRRILSHDRGATQKPGLSRPPPRDEDAGPRVSDAPPPKR